MVKAIRITETGNANVMKFVDVELKKLAPNEVLIRNKAIGLNYIDVYHRAGTYPLPLQQSQKMQNLKLNETKKLVNQSIDEL